MPIYEPITSEFGVKPLVVLLDIGTAFTKFGFTGEFAPRYIIRSEVRCKRTCQIKKLCDYESSQDLYDFLVDFIHMIYFEYALISPKDRPIVIVESLLCPTLFRDTLAKVELFKVLFLQYEVSAMLVVPSHLVCLASLAIDTALVVDVGYKEAVTIPICFGLLRHLKTLLNASNTGVKNLPEDVIENIKVMCCFVTKKSRTDQLALPRTDMVPPPDVKFPNRGVETLMEKRHLKSYMKRQTLAENLVLIGGSSMAPGFKARLKEELLKQLAEDRYKVLNIKEFKFHAGPYKENYAAWLG
ncbi:hypothetical protein YQE_00849, partial [Dendroctonus ponderosae]